MFGPVFVQKKIDLYRPETWLFKGLRSRWRNKEVRFPAGERRPYGGAMHTTQTRLDRCHSGHPTSPDGHRGGAGPRGMRPSHLVSHRDHCTATSPRGSRKRHSIGRLPYFTGRERRPSRILAALGQDFPRSRHKAEPHALGNRDFYFGPFL